MVLAYYYSEMAITATTEMLNKFAESTENLLILSTKSIEERKLVHEFAKAKGYKSRSDYHKYGISHIKCTHCHKWNSTETSNTSNDYCYWKNAGVEPSSFGCIPSDNCLTCKYCDENTYYDDCEELLKWFWCCSGKMIVMKKMQAYKHMGSFRRSRHRSLAT